MLLLSIYVLVALGFSFLCSIAEAVILSVTTAYISVLEQEGRPSGSLLRKLKEEINSTLAAILTLNTIAHTVGAAGAGAQAAVVFGSAAVGVASAILTLLILVFSEIIPKSLGAAHWRLLAPGTAYVLRLLIWILYPFVKMSAWLTRGMAGEQTLQGFSRDEFAAMAELGEQEGQLAQHESRILRNLLVLRETRVTDVMTPRTVVFAMNEADTVADYFDQHGNVRFSRIPVYRGDLDQITGFVLRSDLLLAQARGNTDKPLSTYCRKLPALPETSSLSTVFDTTVSMRAHILLVVDEYGGMSGIVTLEDIVETLLGLEIIDEGDAASDMRELARRLWRRRARDMGLDLDGKD